MAPFPCPGDRMAEIGKMVSTIIDKGAQRNEDLRVTCANVREQVVPGTDVNSCPSATMQRDRRQSPGGNVNGWLAGQASINVVNPARRHPGH